MLNNDSAGHNTKMNLLQKMLVVSRKCFELFKTNDRLHANLLLSEYKMIQRANVDKR